jgi:hypothetical protein
MTARIHRMKGDKTDSAAQDRSSQLKQATASPRGVEGISPGVADGPGSASNPGRRDRHAAIFYVFKPALAAQERQ